MALLLSRQISVVWQAPNGLLPMVRQPDGYQFQKWLYFWHKLSQDFYQRPLHAEIQGVWSQTQVLKGGIAYQWRPIDYNKYLLAAIPIAHASRHDSLDLEVIFTYMRVGDSKFFGPRPTLRFDGKVRALLTYLPFS
jgi:hypothetical protein